MGHIELHDFHEECFYRIRSRGQRKAIKRMGTSHKITSVGIGLEKRAEWREILGIAGRLRAKGGWGGGIERGKGDNNNNRGRGRLSYGLYNIYTCLIKFMLGVV